MWYGRKPRVTMADIDLTTFERKIVVRQLRAEDFEAIVQLQRRCFPAMSTWTKAQFQSQLETFPEGQFCVEIDARIAASAASLIVDYGDYSRWGDWYQISGSGFIRNHDPEGDTLYGIEIMVDPEFRGLRLARRLYEERKRLCREKNLARMVIGGRVPGYAAFKEQLSPQEYVRAVIDKKLIDPVLTTQLSNGFVLKEIIPDYLPSDEDSAGFATCLEWPNLDHTPARYQRERRVVNLVRLGLVQYPMRAVSSWDEFAVQCRFFVDVAADNHVDFAVFPELFTLQLSSLVAAGEPAATARKLAKLTPDVIRLFSELSLKFHLNIVGGSHFVLENDDLYNVSFVFLRDGRIAKQYKLHITPSEKRWWGLKGGDRVEVLDTDRGRIAVLICYDVEFPELVRIAVQKGAQILFVPFNTNDRAGYLRVRYCAQARCIENHVYTAIAGCVGMLPFVDNADIHHAQSAIFTPSDIGFAREGIANESSPAVETVLIHDVDTELLRRHRVTGTVQNFIDRRTDLYRVVWNEQGDRQEV